MFRGKVVFVLGAGASKEIGFPLGAELKADLAERLRFSFKRGYDLQSGDPAVANAISTMSQEVQTASGDLWKAASDISLAMPQALSIDNFLQAHRHDKSLLRVGKIAIVRAILEAEKKSPLLIEPAQKVDFSRLSTTWYAKFFQLLTANVELSDVASVFNNVSVITFNYDRSLEQFLMLALGNYYRISLDRSAEITNSLPIVHPYGVAGLLQWQDRGAHVPYGGSDWAVELMETASQINTFAESVTNPKEVGRIQSLLSEADCVIFLGFAFHEINMKLITIEGRKKTRKVYATAYGISDSDCLIIEQEVKNCLATISGTISVDPDVTCAGLFDRNWRAFNSL